MPVKLTRAPKKQVGGEVTLIAKAESSDMVSVGASFPEDEFKGSYFVEGSAEAAGANAATLEPTFKPAVLRSLVLQNNTLSQCVAAMEVNVDGTGHTIELIDGETDDEKQKKIAEDFFNEPYPQKSMITIRREARVDGESGGNMYYEVIRNMKGEVVMLNSLKAEYMRLVRLDEPVWVKKTLRRGGEDTQVPLFTRERRFVQQINGKRVFFKEFGASRNIDRKTGKWLTSGRFKDFGTEVIHIPIDLESRSAYGVPRWINQIPSVLGSRRAEEFNLEFFDAGGLPPVMVIVQGGYLAKGMKETLSAHLGGKGVKHRAVVVEAQSASGSLDSTGTVKVTVERFGTERQQDSMFQQYDKNAAEHVREAFRLPPMFLGKSQDYNFATALTAYMTAEAQVFLPEREEFDQAMKPVMRALGVTKYRFKSKPVTLANVELQLKGLQMAVDGKFANMETVLKELNKLTGLNLEFESPPDPIEMMQAMTAAKLGTTPTPAGDKKDDQTSSKEPSGQRADPTKPGSQQVSRTPEEIKKSEEVVKEMLTMAQVHLVTELVTKWAKMIGIWGNDLTADEEAIVRKSVDGLNDIERKFFDTIMSSRSLVNVTHDPQGLAELAGCAALSTAEDE